MKRYLLAAGALALSGIAAASAHSYLQKDISILHPWARPTAEAAKTGAVYLSVSNRGETADTIVSASTPVADKAEIHEHVEENGVLRMRAVQGGLKLAPGTSAEFKPGGLHIMLFGLKQRLEEGTSFPLTLVFEKAGKLALEVRVQRGPSGDHKAH
jgi:copper(I)-binding protein